MISVYKRFSLLDTLRGLAVINMIFYHALWDIVYLFDIPILWYENWPGFLWQQAICFTFILISGFCQYFAAHSYIDSLKILAASLIVDLVSFLFSPSDGILFGILTLIGTSILITAILKKGLDKIKPIFGLIIFLIFFLLTRDINYGYLGFYGIELIKLPQNLYLNHFSFFRTFLGFTSTNFVSADYFSLIPWIFLFLIGFYISDLIFSKNQQKILYLGESKFFSFFGRHALLIYLIHQPIIYVLLLIVFEFFY